MNPAAKIAPLAMMLLCGCVSGYRAYYHQVAPKPFAPTTNIRVLGYHDADLDSVYEGSFSDWLIIGRSQFNGPLESPQQLKSLAQSVGADAVLYSIAFTETENITSHVTVPDFRSTQIDGSYAGQPFSASATSIGTRETPFTIPVKRFDQQAIFLKNVNNAPWVGDPSRYSPTGASSLWSSEKYRIKVYESGSNIVGVLDAALAKASPRAKAGELKFVFDPKSGAGTYLMLDGFPLEGQFRTNSFGHLEITLPDRTVSFEREK